MITTILPFCGEEYLEPTILLMVLPTAIFGVYQGTWALKHVPVWLKITSRHRQYPVRFLRRLIAFS